MLSLILLIRIMTDLEIPVETTTEFLIRVGLYIGAIFQLTCILAIIILPDKSSDEPIAGRVITFVHFYISNLCVESFFLFVFY